MPKFRSLSPWSRTLVLACVLAAVMVIVTAGDARADIDSIRVRPSVASIYDTAVTIEVYGSYTDRCWTIDSTAFAREGDTFLFTQSATDIWLPEAAPCDTVDLDYTLAYDVSPLTEAIYVVKMVEYNESIRRPPADSQMLAFAVDDYDYAEDLLCGDVSVDYQVTLGDVVFLINIVFKQGPLPYPVGVGDVNGDGQINIGDAIYLIGYLYREGPAPQCPDIPVFVRRPWAKRSLINANLNAVAWSGNRFVAVGAVGSAYISDDGRTWDSVNTGVDAYLADVIWDGTRFIAVGTSPVTTDSCVVLHSTDGQVWNRVPVPYVDYPDNMWYNCLAWTGSVYVIAGSGGAILTSPDAVTWEITEEPLTIVSRTFNALTWSDSGLIAAGVQYDSLGDHALIGMSPDGGTWSYYSINVLNDFGFLDIAWTGDRFIGVGGNELEYPYEGGILVSNNGKNWTIADHDMPAPLYAVDIKGALIVSAGDEGCIYTSFDGVQWKRETNIDDVPFRGISHSDKRIVVLGLNGALYTFP